MLFLFLAITFTVNLSCSAKQVAIFGWYTNSWINNVFAPAGIDTIASNILEQPAEWGKYPMVVITQGSGYPKFDEKANNDVYSYIEKGGILILTGAASGQMGTGPKSILDISPKEKWFGAELYAYGTKTPFVVVNNEHPLVSHLEVGREYNWEGLEPGLRVGRLTSGKLLVGSEKGAAIFFNKVGKGQCIYLIGNPQGIDDAEYNEDYAQVVSKVAKLISDDAITSNETETKKIEITGDPNLPIDSPTNLEAEAELARVITLKWITPGGGKSARRAYMYKVIRSVAKDFPEELSQEFQVRPVAVPSPAADEFEWLDSDIEPGLVYYYQVIAYDEFLNESSPSNVAIVVAPILPGLE